MSSPITWRNVGSDTNPAAISSVFDAATRNFSGGLGALGGILKDTQAVQDNNVKAIDEAAKQAYLNQLAGAKTPEELAALQASGALDRGRAGLSVASQAAVRGADEARTTALRTNLTASQQFGIAQQDVRDAPVHEQIAALRAAGKTTEADALVAANPQLRVASADVAANRVEALKRVQDARTVVQQGQQDALASAAAPNNLAAEAFKARLRPTAESNALKEGALKGTQLGIQTTEANNQVQDQLVEEITAPASQAFQAEQLKTRGKLSDTAAMEAHLRALRADPRVTPEAINRNQAKIAGAFNTVAVGAPVGNDALAKATRQAEADVVQKEGDARNRFAPGSPDALNAYADLAKQVDATLPENVKEDGPHLQSMLARFATKGIEIKPGVFVVPSTTDVLGELQGYTANFGGNFLNRTRARDIEENLKNTLADVDVTKLLAAAEKSKIADRARNVRNILNPLTPAVGPLNPLNLPPPPKK